MDEYLRDKAAEQLKEITQAIIDDYSNGRDIDKMNVFAQPERDVVIDIVKKMLNVLFPGYYRDKTYKFYNLENKISTIIEDVLYNLAEQIGIALEYDDEIKAAGGDTTTKIGSACISVRSQMLAVDFLKRVPEIRAMVNTDIKATYDGDPAADAVEEIVLCYPGLLASTVYRMAHELYELGVPVIPRMMTEYAHNLTGIDIHPGATIGEYFFMDHGTGIVVGSTAVIGKHVKIYQGVTIGALSTSGGHALHGTRRHPTIEDNVTIYSGASILGGNTVIGEGSVIGGNAFLTASVPPHSKISMAGK